LSGSNVQSREAGVARCRSAEKKKGRGEEDAHQGRQVTPRERRKRGMKFAGENVARGGLCAGTWRRLPRGRWAASQLLKKIERVQKKGGGVKHRGNPSVLTRGKEGAVYRIPKLWLGHRLWRGKGTRGKSKARQVVCSLPCSTNRRGNEGGVAGHPDA